MFLIRGWSYFLGSYFWCGLISGVVLLLVWSYFWAGLNVRVVLNMGLSHLWGGFISGMVLFLCGLISRGGLTVAFHSTKNNHMYMKEKETKIRPNTGSYCLPLQEKSKLLVC